MSYDDSIIENMKTTAKDEVHKIKDKIVSRLNEDSNYEFGEACDEFLNDIVLNGTFVTDNVEESLQVLKECLVDHVSRVPDEFPFVSDASIDYDLQTKASRILETAAFDAMEGTFNNIVAEHEAKRELKEKEAWQTKRKVSGPEM